MAYVKTTDETPEQRKKRLIRQRRYNAKPESKKKAKAHYETIKHTEEYKKRTKEATQRWLKTPEAKVYFRNFQKENRAANKEYFRLKEWEWRQKNPLKRLLKSTKQTARKRNLEHTISVEDLGEMPVICPVLGIPIVLDNTSTKLDSPSVDRIDNNEGYIPGNVIIISYKANIIKNCASVEEMMKVALFYQKLEEEKIK